LRSVTEPKVRAVAPETSGNAAEIRFVYDGPSAESARLASGQLRRQIGLKLRAENGCNLLYVMWRIEPKAEIVVSVKRNPGMRIHRECGANGYQNLKPSAGLLASAGAPAMTMAPGSRHALHAVLDGQMLRVWADRALVWQGDVGAEVRAFHGPAGVRTDNGRFTVELRAAPGREAAPAAAASDGDED
jgi:hypothetical protein